METISREKTNISFRPAKISEAQYLSDLALRSKSIYDYPTEYIEKCRDALTVSEEYIQNWPVVVIEQKSETIGFYALKTIEGENRLDHLWLEPKVIGQSVGRQAFAQIIAEAKKLGWDSFRIVADPKALGFYEKMGAVKIGMTQSRIAPDIFLPHMEYSIK